MIEENNELTEENGRTTEENNKTSEESNENTEKTNTKRARKILIIATAAVIAIALGLGIFAAIKHFKGRSDNDSSDIPDTSSQTDVPMGFGKEATVILLAGQSNAAGCSYDEYLKANVSPEKYAEYEKGYDNVYINYFVSGTNESHRFVKCATRQGEFKTRFGPELGMAEKLNELYPDKTFFIIKYACSATNLYDHWLSPSSRGKTGKTYSEFEEFVQTNLEYLVSKGYNVKIEGLCWNQGESDSFFVDTATNYESNLAVFISDVRKRFESYAADDGIAFIDAEIANNPVYWVLWDLVNASKRAVADLSTMNVLIKTDDLIYSEEPAGKPDLPHYDSMSELELGYRYIEALSNFI